MVIVYKVDKDAYLVPIKGGTKRITKADEGILKIIDKIGLYELRQTFPFELTTSSLGDISVNEGWINRGGKRIYFALIGLGNIIKPLPLKEEVKKIQPVTMREEVKKMEEEKKAPAKKAAPEEQKKKTKELPQILTDTAEIFGILLTGEAVEYQQNLWKEYELRMDKYDEKHTVLTMLAGVFPDQFNNNT